MGEPTLHGHQGSSMRHIKFPRTRRDRFREEGRLYESGTFEADPQADGVGPAARTYDAVRMQTFPIPPHAVHNVTWADHPEGSTTSGEATSDDTTDQSESRDGDEKTAPPQAQQSPTRTNNNDRVKEAVLAGTTIASGRGPQEVSPPNNTQRPWIQIPKVDGDDADGPPVLGPAGRTPPPVRKNFRFPEEEEDDDDVFYDETVPEVVFNDEEHHPSYGQYIPGQYQHTLNYLYGLETIREVDESMLYNQDTFKEKASSYDICVMLLTLIGYLVNVGADIWLAYSYFRLGYYWWFVLTLLFVLLPSLAMTIFSLVLYIQDHRVLNTKASVLRWFIRSFFLVLLLAPVMRIIDMLHSGFKSRWADDWRQRRRHYDRMRDEDTDFNLVRLFEAFLENAPQLVLQLYVIVVLGGSKGTLLVIIQVVGLVVSLTTMAWSLVSFQAALRASLPDKAELTWGGKFMLFAWRIMTISARVVALALFASYFKVYVFAVIGAHFVLMFFWMTGQKTTYCLVESKTEAGEPISHHSSCLEFCFRVMAAFVHIFCFFNLLEGHTRLRCLVFYVIVYLENTVMILCWYILGSTHGHGGWYQMPAVAMVMAGFMVGVGFQIIYYLWCHPNHKSRYHRHRRIRLCVPYSELSLFKSMGTGTDVVVENQPVLEQGPQNGPSKTKAASTVSSMGPFVAPMETSTPAPSAVGVSVSTPQKPAPAASPPSGIASPESAKAASPSDRPTLPILPGTSPADSPHRNSPTIPDRDPEPQRSRPTTPARELEVQRSRPTTPAKELEAQSSRPTTPARELESQRSKPPVQPRKLDLRQFRPTTPTEDPKKYETEV